MSLITGSIKDILSIKLKYRHDDYSDQFSRIFMAKMFVIASLIMSIDFFSDEVACIVPGQSDLSKDFVHSACWIQGFYIYEELKHRMSESGYFGIPKLVELDGIRPDGELCQRINKATHLLDETCKPMTKLFYLQFQYFPFYIASLAILYYLPYIVFRVVNADMLSLKSNLKTANVNKIDGMKITDNYFNRSMNGGVTKLRMKIVANLCIKVLYIIVNITCFIITNKLLSYNYMDYGTQWIKWSYLNNSYAFDYGGIRNYPKPGNYLLPPMGFCEIAEGSKDVRSSFVNQNKFICEISPNVLYQYVLIVLWFLFVIGIAIAILGLLLKIASYLRIRLGCMRGKNKFNDVTKTMILREIEYLNFIQTKNLPMYGDVIRILRKQNPSTGRLVNAEFEDDTTKPCRNSLIKDFEL